MARPAKHNKADILDAAARVIEAEGGAKLSLDRVAKEAGISKGGLLHLFPSKKALLQGLVERFKDTLFTTFHTLSDAPPQEKLRAYIKAHVDGVRESSFYAGLFTAAINDASILDVTTDFYRQAIAEFTGSDIAEEKASLIMMAVEGVAMFHSLGIRPLTEEQERSLIDEVYKIIDG